MVVRWSLERSITEKKHKDEEKKKMSNRVLPSVAKKPDIFYQLSRVYIVHAPLRLFIAWSINTLSRDLACVFPEFHSSCLHYILFLWLFRFVVRAVVDLALLGAPC